MDDLEPRVLKRYGLCPADGRTTDGAVRTTQESYTEAVVEQV
jgi:hypothetical protein